MKAPTIFLMTVFVLGLPGCSIDSNRRAQALNGIGLLAQIDKELQTFQLVEQASENYLLYSNIEQRAKQQQIDDDVKREDLALAAAGMVIQINKIQVLNNYVNGLANVDVNSGINEKSLKERMSKLLAPLPSATASIKSTQLKYAELSKIIPWKVRVSEYKAIYDSVKENYDINVKKIADTPVAPLEN